MKPKKDAANTRKERLAVVRDIIEEMDGSKEDVILRKISMETGLTLSRSKEYYDLVLQAVWDKIEREDQQEKKTRESTPCFPDG